MQNNKPTDEEMRNVLEGLKLAALGLTARAAREGSGDDINMAFDISKIVDVLKWVLGEPSEFGTTFVPRAKAHLQRLQELRDEASGASNLFSMDANN